MTTEPHPRIRVLIVDDSSFTRRVIRLLLENAGGFEIVGEAGDGEEALDMARALQPDAITLDHHMPRVNGLEMLARLRRESAVPVVMVSALPIADSLPERDRLEPVDFILKTFTADSIDLSVFAGELTASILRLYEEGEGRRRDSKRLYKVNR